MNNIKFRAYCKKRKEFVRIVDLGLFGTGEVKSVAFTYKDEPYERMDCDLPGDVELVQYAGLKDKNGAEIYEGDIVENASKDLKFQVVYEAPSFNRKWIDGISKGYRAHLTEPLAWNTYVICEVIGNIYENPELLGDSQ